MEETGSPKTETPSSTIIEFLSIVTKYRKFISRFVLSATLITIIVAFLMPKWFKSTASVFPAEKADLFGLEGISSLAKNLSPAKALLGSNPEADRYMAILKSATVVNAVIQKFDLVKVYDITSYPGEKTAKELLNNTEFTVEQEGNLTVTVYDKEPQRAADMANYFVEMLNTTNTELQVQNARGNREFIEQRYKKNKLDLAAAEDSLKAFQKKYGIIAMPEQTEASIKAAAEITAQLALKEVQMGVLRRTQSPDNPTVTAAQIEIEEFRNKLSQMNGSGTNVSKDLRVFVPFSRIPDLGVEYVRRFREVEIQYKILQFILPLYEQAKVEERRQTPSVIVLDVAGPAERKAKPKRVLIIFGGFIIALAGSLAGVFMHYRWNKAKAVGSRTYISIMGFAEAIKTDLNSIRFSRRL